MQPRSMAAASESSLTSCEYLNFNCLHLSAYHDHLPLYMYRRHGDVCLERVT